MAVFRAVYEKINITCFPHINQHVKTIVNCKIPEKQLVWNAVSLYDLIIINPAIFCIPKGSCSAC